MPTLEEIKSQISNIDGGSKFFGFKEIKELPNILWEDEVVECLVQGVYGNGMGILCSTNKRLVFVDKGMLYGLKVEDFPYAKITSIQYETGMLMGKITIFASGNKADIDHIDARSNLPLRVLEMDCHCSKLCLGHLPMKTRRLRDDIELASFPFLLPLLSTHWLPGAEAVSEEQNLLPEHSSRSIYYTWWL